MERKELILELKELKTALDEKSKKEGEVYSCCWYDSDYEKYMDSVPQPPSESQPVAPVEPKKPSNERDRFWQDQEKIDFNDYKNIIESSTKLKFEITGWHKKVLIIGSILSAIILILGIMVTFYGNSDLKYAHEWFNQAANQTQVYDQYIYEVNTAESAIKTGVITLIASPCIAVISVLVGLISAHISIKQKAIAETILLKKHYEETNANVEKLNALQREKKAKALKDYELYEQNLLKHQKEMAEYKTKLEAYNLKVTKYKAEYSKQLQLAKNKVVTHNKNVEEIAENEFNAKLQTLNVEYPQKYYYAIDQIITILEDCRADSLKEAINVLKQDEHNQNVLYEQRRLADAQEEYNSIEFERQVRETERWDAEQRKRQYEKENIQKNRDRCAICARRFTCAKQNSITSICTDFRLN